MCGKNVRVAIVRVAPRHLPAFALLGLIGVGLHQVVWITSVQLNGVGIATVLVYIQPAIVALVASRFMGERLEKQAPLWTKQRGPDRLAVAVATYRGTLRAVRRATSSSTMAVVPDTSGSA